jgi:hypothetical protein
LKLVLDNLGRIEHAELELRPLTVFVGENNTNKTWAAYCLYGLARQLMIANPASYDGNPFPVEPEATGKAIEAAIRRAIEGVSSMALAAQNATFSIARRDLVRGIEGDVTFRLTGDRIFDLLGLDILPTGRAAIVASAEEFVREDSIAEFRLDNGLRTVSVSFAGPGVQHSVSAQATSTGSTEVIIARVLGLLAQGFMPRANALLLPAERKALVETYKVLLTLGGAGFGPRPPGQVSRVPGLEQIMTAPAVDFMRRLWAAEYGAFDKVAPSDTFRDVLALLEGDILGGEVDYETMGADNVRLSYGLRASGRLPMRAASSLVRSLAGLDLYLRYWAHPGDLLIIDEPEMNAHPEAQIRIAELVGLLVNKGIRVVLTTHSPYIVDHLNDLIRAGDLSPEDQAEVAPRFKLRSSAAFLRAEQVAAHVFEAADADARVTVRSIFDREDRHLIDWETFSRTTDYMTNLFSTEIAPRLPR